MTKSKQAKRWIHSDGGRAAAGFKGKAGDCVCRAIAIATGLPYAEVWARLAAGCGRWERTPSGRRRAASASHGIDVKRKWYKNYMRELGFVWTPMMRLGSGCKVHFKADELPKGRLVVQVSRHSVAVINGIIHDVHDCARSGRRCVCGYWKLTELKP
jgi:hypothetical protein